MGQLRLGFNFFRANREGSKGRGTGAQIVVATNYMVRVDPKLRISMWLGLK